MRCGFIPFNHQHRELKGSTPIAATAPYNVIRALLCQSISLEMDQP